MNHPIPKDLIEAVAADWNAKVDALRIEFSRQMGDAYKKHDYDFATKITKHINEISNNIEIARQVFNYYLATGEVKHPN